MPAEPTRLLVLPYFELTGPPAFVVDASGVIAGLKVGTTRGEILKAIMECTTFYFVDSIHALSGMGMDTSEFVATGGGSRSDAWLQIKADVFGVPFVRTRWVDGAVVGAAILAGTAAGVYGSAAEGVERLVRRDRIFEPDPARHAAYGHKLDQYRALFPLMKDFLSGLEQGAQAHKTG
jgi:xylulokinase